MPARRVHLLLLLLGLLPATGASRLELLSRDEAVTESVEEASRMASHTLCERVYAMANELELS